MKRASKNRMPKSKMNNRAIAAKMKKLYQKRYRKEKVQRVVITSSNWISKTIIFSTKKGYLVKRHFKYLYASIAVKKGRRYVVYAMGFRKSVGGSLQLQSVGESYPILRRNIKK